MRTKVAREYLEKLRRRYKEARRSEKYTILNELTKTVGYERKYAINLLRGNYKHKTGKVHRHHILCMMHSSFPEFAASLIG